MNRVHHVICGSALWRCALSKKLIPWDTHDIGLGDHILEVGPGPGHATDILRARVSRLTAIEIDRDLAHSLGRRLTGTNVAVVAGDATAMPFADAQFTGGVSFTMLHHVPSAAQQDRLFAEVYRVLRPGAMFAGTDSRDSWGMRLIHRGDTMVIVDPHTLGARLERAGFREVAVTIKRRAFRFRARKAS